MPYDIPSATTTAKEKLLTATSFLKLWVVKPGGEKQDLDKLEALTMDGAFRFTKLFSEYEIKRRNPIAVELPQ